MCCRGGKVVVVLSEHVRAAQRVVAFVRAAWPGHLVSAMKRGEQFFGDSAASVCTGGTSSPIGQGRQQRTSPPALGSALFFRKHGVLPQARRLDWLCRRIWAKYEERGVPWKVFVRIARAHDGKALPGGYALRLSAHRLRTHYFTWLKVRSVQAWPWRYGSPRRTPVSASLKRAFIIAASVPGVTSFAAAVRAVNRRYGVVHDYRRLHRTLTLRERAALRSLFVARLELGRLERKVARVLR